MTQPLSYTLYRNYCIEYLGATCVYCGATEALEIDHIDRAQKKFAVSKVWSRVTKIELDNELDKCQLLCYTCHRKKTNSELAKEKQWKHGTQYGWMKKKCVCINCYNAKREWHTKRNRQRRIGKGYKERF